MPQRCLVVRVAAGLLVLLVAGSSLAEPIVIGNTGAPEGFTMTTGIAWIQEGALLPDQDVSARLAGPNGTLWDRSSVHEHGGLSITHWTMPRYPVVIEGGIQSESFRQEIQWQEKPQPGPASLASMESTQLVLEGPTLRIEKQDEKGIRGPWILRDEAGPILSGWAVTYNDPQHQLATTYAATPLAAEMTLVGRVGSRIITTEGQAPAALPEVPKAERLLLGECGSDVHVDPLDPVAGSIVEVALVPLAQPDMLVHRGDYELVRVDGVARHLVHAWHSDGPMAQTTFRLPPGPHELRISGGGGACKLVLEAQEAATGTTSLELNATARNGTLHVEANTGHQGHYEFRLHVHHDTGQTAGSSLVWAGHLHSHGEPAHLVVQGLQNGTYEIFVDAWPQTASPSVDGAHGQRIRVEMLHDDPPEVPADIESPWPGFLALVASVFLGALLRRRA